MNQFYVSIIFIGITLIVFSLVWIAYDKKKSHDYLDQVNAKKEELVTIINDAEQMIEEMNKFSDYIVTQMELKNEEMCSNIKSLEERMKQVNDAMGEMSELKVVSGRREKVVNGSNIDVRLGPDNQIFVPNSSSDLVIDNIRFEGSNNFTGYTTKTNQKSRDKVIPLNSRHKEVIRLSQSGMNDTEIAKTLNMGKGEVQLILGMNR